MRLQFNQANPIGKQLQAWQDMLVDYQHKYQADIQSYVLGFSSIFILAYNISLWRTLWQQYGIICMLLSIVCLVQLYFIVFSLLMWERYSAMMCSALVSLANSLAIYCHQLNNQIYTLWQLNLEWLQEIYTPKLWIYIFCLGIWPLIGIIYLINFKVQPARQTLVTKLRHMAIASISLGISYFILYATFITTNSQILQDLKLALPHAYLR